MLKHAGLFGFALVCFSFIDKLILTLAFFLLLFQDFRETILVILEHFVEFLNVVIEFAVLVLKVLLVLLFDLLEDVHLVEQPFNLIVPLVLLHPHEVVEVLDQVALESLLDILTLTDRVVDCIQLLFIHVEVGRFAKHFSKGVIDLPELVGLWNIFANTEGVVVFHSGEDLDQVLRGV